MPTFLQAEQFAPSGVHGALLCPDKSPAVHQVEVPL